MRILIIRYTSHFLRAFKKLPNALHADIREREGYFRADCFDPRLHTHKLKGQLYGYWSFSITKKHRILFIFSEKSSVDFIDIGDHSLYQ